MRSTVRRSIRHQRGVVLVIALLVLGVVAGLATMLGNEFMLSLRRSENQLRSEQAWQYLLAAEELAALLLENDRDLERDHLGEIWAQEMPPYQIDGGWLRGRIEDLQGRFNVNSLRRNPPEQGLPPPVPASENEKRFVRLLQFAGGEAVDLGRAQALTEAIIDWIDTDREETGFGGAEDGFYGSREPGFRPANQPLRSLSELRLLPDMEPELYQLLRRQLSIWPDNGAPINVNTAGPALLAALAVAPPGALGEVDVQALLEARGDAEGLPEPDPSKGFENTDAFVGDPAWPEPPPPDNLAVASNWFLLTTEVEYQGLYWQMESVLERVEGQVRVRARALGGL
jgi:general secretion pathway protein K